MAKIIKYTRNGAYLIPKGLFYCLYQDIVGDWELRQRFSWQRSAIACFQVAAEEFMVMTITGKLNCSPYTINSFTNDA